MQLLWVMLSLGSALASAVPSSHQLRLPFAPSTDDLENCVRSRLVRDKYFCFDPINSILI